MQTTHVWTHIGYRHKYLAINTYINLHCRNLFVFYTYIISFHISDQIKISDVFYTNDYGANRLFCLRVQTSLLSLNGEVGRIAIASRGGIGGGGPAIS